MRFSVTLSVTFRDLLRNRMNYWSFSKTQRCYIPVNFPAQRGLSAFSQEFST
jgi:hypothetical protein